jgi:dipeptidyl aminopeptidase/acylaminoacyl peptidase
MFRLLSALALAGVLAAAAPCLAAPPPVEDYGKLPAMEMVTLSPSGERYAFVGDDGGVRRLFIATTDDKPVARIGIGAVKVRDVEWAGDDFVLVHFSATVRVGGDYLVDKQELSSAIVINLRNHTQMTAFEHGRGQVDSAVFGMYGTAKVAGRWYGYFGGLAVAPGGNGIYYHTNVTDDGDIRIVNADLFRVDLETGDVVRVARGQLKSRWLVSPQGDIVARSLYWEKTGDWSVMTGASGGRELAAGRSSLGGASLLGMSRTTDAILISRASDDGVDTEELPLNGGPARPVANDLAGDGRIMDVRNGLWIGSTTDGDDPVSTLFSPAGEAKLRGAYKAFPGYRMALISWSADFNRMIVFTDGGDDSGTYWIVDIAKKSADVLGGAYPTVKPADVGPVRMVDWKVADGLAMRGVLTLPPGREAKNLPLVVLPHGGPVDRDYPGFDWWAQAYASRGYAVFQPNFRGSSGYGDKFVEAGYGQWGRKMQTDISDGVAELARHGIVDPKRACIVGGSYGGYAALAGVTVQQGLYRCSVSMGGIADVGRMYNEKNEATGGGDNSTTRYWKTFLGARAGWAAISPAKLAARADAPILLIHGKDDTVVPIDQSDAMERALRAAGKPVERLTLDHADHWLLEQDARVAMLKASAAFVEKYNPPDPAK